MIINSGLLPYKERYYKDLNHSNKVRRNTSIHYLDNDRRYNIEHYNIILAKVIKEKINLSAYYQYFDKRINIY